MSFFNYYLLYTIYSSSDLKIYKAVVMKMIRVKSIWTDFQQQNHDVWVLLIIIISHVPLQNFVAHASCFFVEGWLLLRGGIFVGGVKNSR